MPTWHCRHHPPGNKATAEPMPHAAELEYGYVVKQVLNTATAAYAARTGTLPSVLP